MSVRRRLPESRIVPANGYTRYDLLLAALPAPLLAGLVVAFATGTSTSAGVGIGSVGSAALLGYALFYDPPTEATSDAAGSPTRSFAPGDD
ncbi:MAG: hypothetical protein ABEJ61_10455 [Haloferacaceae archaeon]